MSMEKKVTRIIKDDQGTYVVMRGRLVQLIFKKLHLLTDLLCQVSQDEERIHQLIVAVKSNSRLQEAFKESFAADSNGVHLPRVRLSGDD